MLVINLGDILVNGLRGSVTELLPAGPVVNFSSVDIVTQLEPFNFISRLHEIISPFLCSHFTTIYLSNFMRAFSVSGQWRQRHNWLLILLI